MNCTSTILSVSLREPDILRRLREETEPYPHSFMQISPDQGQFMALLVRLIAATRTIDIGVYTGYSSLSVAMALPDDGKVVACDVNEEWTSVAKRVLGRSRSFSQGGSQARAGHRNAGRPFG